MTLDQLLAGSPVVIGDGAMSTMLQVAGLPLGVGADRWTLEHPDRVTAVHRAYAAAGARWLQTNTFGGTVQGTLLRNLIAPQGLNLRGADNLSEESRWAATHVSFSKFSIKRDSQVPTLTKVLGRRGFTDESGVPYDRVELTFSEPMVVYPQLGAKSLLSLNNYIITTADTEPARKAGRADCVAAEHACARRRIPAARSARGPANDAQPCAGQRIPQRQCPQQAPPWAGASTVAASIGTGV